MTIDVDPEWWKTLFDEVYLLTDARSVDDEDITCREMDVFTALVPMQADDRILDLCGGHGRHALELCRRGFRDCTVVDYSTSLLAIGKRNACRLQYPVQFVQADARCPALTDGVFDHVMILGNSLGYLLEPDADLRILQECRRLLKTGGWLLLDVTDGDAVRTQSTPAAWHEIGDEVVVCRRREVTDRCVRAREMVLSKTRGLIRDQTYRIRLYAADELTELVGRAGFGELRLVPDASVLDRTQDLGCMNHRLVVVARKA